MKSTVGSCIQIKDSGPMEEQNFGVYVNII